MVKRLMMTSVILLAIAGPAHALSCMETTIEQQFNRAVDASERYSVVAGTLTFDSGKLPQTDWDNQTNTPPKTFIDARITGKALTKEGFTQAYSKNVTLEVQCAGPWCGGARSGIEYLAFINVDQSPPRITASACPGHIFAEPSAAQKGSVVACFQAGRCQGFVQ